MKLIFLLEELSMKCLLDELLPRMLPVGVDFQTIAHHGKRDLEKSVPRKLRGWNEPGDIRFVILHDQDNKDYVQLKQSLIKLCKGTHRPVLIRIACQELEAWYFGDISALAAAYNNPKLKELATKKKYRNPDSIPNPKEELYKLVCDHQQIEGAKRVAPHMDIEHNTSTSFNALVSGIHRLIQSS